MTARVIPADGGIVVTPELLAELKRRAAEANSLYDLARRVWKRQRKRQVATDRARSLTDQEHVACDAQSAPTSCEPPGKP